MNIGLWLSVAGVALSLGSLTWNNATVRRVALFGVILVCATLLAEQVVHQRYVNNLQQRVVRALATNKMTADQLFESLPDRQLSRSDFDEALNRAYDTGAVQAEMSELRTVDSAYIRVRMYSTGAPLVARGLP